MSWLKVASSWKCNISDKVKKLSEVWEIWRCDFGAISGAAWDLILFLALVMFLRMLLEIWCYFRWCECFSKLGAFFYQGAIKSSNLGHLQLLANRRKWTGESIKGWTHYSNILPKKDHNRQKMNPCYDDEPYNNTTDERVYGTPTFDPKR